MLTTLDNSVLYEMLKKAVSEVFDEKLIEFKLATIPVADDNEHEEINSLFGSPKQYKNQEFTKVSL